MENNTENGPIDLAAKETELAQREERLRNKEEELEKKEESIRAVGMRDNLYSRINVPLKTMDRFIFFIVILLVIVLMYGIIKAQLH